MRRTISGSLIAAGVLGVLSLAIATLSVAQAPPPAPPPAPALMPPGLPPTLVVEVLSPSTADYDRGDKLLHYQRIPSLEGVLLVDHEAPCIDFCFRLDGAWRSRRFGPGA